MIPLHPIRHFITITHHRHLVRSGCFQVGLIWQGLTHDLSKYSPTEFWHGAKYYQGTRSPNAKEREEIGWSEAWMHHKGRNKHHFEYWTDLLLPDWKYGPVPMPRRYLAEMMMDRIAACKTYNGAAYTDADPLTYFESAKESKMLHQKTRRELEYLLTMLRDRGEKETFQFIREVVLKGIPFAEEETT